MKPTILNFLEDLRENNNREWFAARKTDYETAKADFDSFINDMIPALRAMDPLIDMVTAKDCTFRIYRDIRFSREKSPYKTNMGAYIARGGKNSQLAGYYVHIEPGQSFLAGGLYMPQPDVLKRVREEIFYHIEEFRAIIDEPGFVKVFGKIDDPEKLVKPPKGFPADFPGIDLLKYKNYAVMHYVPDQVLFQDGFKDQAMNVFQTLFPLNNFFNRIFND